MIPLELFFVINGAMDALLLYLSLLWLEAGRIRLVRILAAASLGALYACLAYHPSLSVLQTLPARFVCAAGMVRIAVGSIPLRQTLRGAVLLMAAAFLSGGAAWAARMALPQHTVVTALLAGALVAGLVGHLWLRRSRRTAMVYGQITLRHRGVELSLDAAVDTGNQALDALTGLPVVVLPRERAERAFPLLASQELPEGMRLIGLRSVSGTALLPCFVPEFISWNHEPVKAVVAVAPRGALRMALAPPGFEAARAGRRLA